MMNIEPGLAIWTIITFVIFLFILKRFAWNPILKALDAREQGIKNDIQAAKNAREEAEKSLEEYRRKLSEAQVEAQAVVAKARRDAERVREELLAKSKREAEAQVERARKQIELERMEAVNQIRSEIAGLVIASAEKVIGKALSAEDHRRLIAEGLRENPN